MTARQIRLLLVEDSPVVRDFMLHLLRKESAIEVVESVSDGAQALEAVRRVQPDVVVMDVHMAGMDGLEATRRLMQENPVPIVVVSGTLEDEVSASFKALEAGALAFLPRPSGIGHPRHVRDASELVRTVLLMAEVRVVRRRTAQQGAPHAVKRAAAPLQVVAIGASTGGPQAIQALLRELPAGFPAPVLIVQHIAEGFLDGFVAWLGQSIAMQVLRATDGALLLPGHVFVAPDCLHMGVDASGRIRLSDGAPDNGLRPSIAHLMQSVRQTYRGGVVGVLLSGMGRDGATELLALRHGGAHTFVQDKASSVVFGMPRVALEMGAARHALAPDAIGREIARIAHLGVCRESEFGR